MSVLTPDEITRAQALGVKLVERAHAWLAGEIRGAFLRDTVILRAKPNARFSRPDGTFWLTISTGFEPQGCARDETGTPLERAVMRAEHHYCGPHARRQMEALMRRDRDRKAAEEITRRAMSIAGGSAMAAMTLPERVAWLAERASQAR